MIQCRIDKKQRHIKPHRQSMREVEDTGFFVVSDKLNASAATACVHVGYRNLYSCGPNSRVDPDSISVFKLFYDLSDTDMIYQEARNYDYCIHDHPEDDLDYCMQQVS
jgi:hypothetical protein